VREFLRKIGKKGGKTRAKIQRDSENGPRNRERDALRNLGRSSTVSQRGVFERDPGLGVWWICYFDRFGKRHREKVGTKSVSMENVSRRYLRARSCQRAFASHRSTFLFEEEQTLLQDGCASFREPKGMDPAEELTPKDIENALARAAEKQKWAPSTFNHYRSLMSLSYRLGF